MATLTPAGNAFLCADYPTRLLMANMADTSSQAPPFVLKGLIQAAFELTYPGQSSWRLAALEENLRLTTITIIIDGVDFVVYSTTSNWDNQLAFDRAQGYCQVGDPPCQRFTISGIGE